MVYTQESEQFLRGGIMVWGAILSTGSVVIAWVKQNITSKVYVQVIDGTLFKNDDVVFPSNYIFMQDNAAPHRAKHTMQYLDGLDIEVLTWPAKSPDLNPIENLWGIVTRAIYIGGKTYKNADELWEAVSEEFMKIPKSTIENLYKSLPGRMVKVLESGGKRINY